MNSLYVENVEFISSLSLKDGRRGLFEMCQQLNWGRNTRFSNLSGIFPLLDDEVLDDRVFDFTTATEGFNVVRKLFDIIMH